MQVVNVCPCCKHNNSADSAYCSQCGTLLLSSRGSIDTVSVNALVSHRIKSPPSATDQLVESLTENEFALKFTKTDELVRFDRDRAVILGRDEDSSRNAYDLSSHGGMEAGVSRQHAVIDNTDEDLTITDLGSTNGTRLNGLRLTPHAPYILRSGDKLQLGTLSFYIYYRMSEAYNRK